VKSFKSNFGKKYNIEQDGMIISRDPKTKELDGSPQEIDFTLTVNFVPNKNLKGHSYSFDAITDFDEITITVYYVTTVFPVAYNDFIAELKETVRHEIEHVAQGFNQGKERIIRKTSRTPYYMYLQMPHEVPAYVQGLYKRSKTKKQTLTKSIDEFMQENSKSFGGNKYKEIVKKVWIDWAKKNLKNAQLD
jgi:hypothetical protein